MYIKRSMKTICSFSLVCTLLLCATSAAFASNMPPIETRLRSRGYPPQVLCLLNDKMKRALVSSNGVFDSASLHRIKNEKTLELRANEPQAVKNSRYTLNKDQFSLMWLISTNPDGSKTVTLQYNWKKPPFFRWQDPIGISWDREAFYLKTGSFKKVDSYQSHPMFSSKLESAVHSEELTYANGNFGTVLWYADLKGHSLFNPVSDLSGFATFTLIPLIPSGTTQLTAYYAHAMLSSSINLTLDENRMFTVSDGNSYSGQSSSIDITW